MRTDQIFGNIFKRNMNLFLTFFFIFVSFALGEDKKVELDDGVLVLTQENFDTTISDTEYILVEFYAPWCGHCKSLEPEYAKAAKILDDEESIIKLAKVDATVEESLAERLKIEGFPTLKYFRKGNPIDYEGGRTANEIVKWVTRKAGSAARELKDVAEAKNLLKDNDIIAIGFFKDLSSEDAKVFLEAANIIDDFPLGITSNEKVFKEYSAKDGVIILFRKFDTPRVQFEGELNAMNLKKFLLIQSLPLLSEFDLEIFDKLLKVDVKTFLILFLSESVEEASKIKETVRSVAKAFKNTIPFFTIDTDKEINEVIMADFKIKDREIPTTFIVSMRGEITMYKSSADQLTANTIKDFVQNYLDGNLKPYLVSQDLPADWNKGSVYTLVASNFETVALDPKKDVLIQFYAPWCQNCKKLQPIYEEIGKYFEDNDDIIIARFDVTANEDIKDTYFETLPTVILCRKEDNEAIVYYGSSTLEALIEFVESGGEMKDEEEERHGSQTKDEL